MLYNGAMVRVILGRAGAGKTALVFREIAGYVSQGRGDLVLLVPEQYSHEAERELCAVAGDKLSRYGEVLSFTGLARKVFSQVGGARPALDGGGRVLCMAVAVQAVGERLRLYRQSRKEVRLLDSLARAAEELKNAGAGAADLLAAADKAEGLLADKLRDLALLLEAYTAVQEQSGMDGADRLAALADLIGESSAVNGTFYVDGFSDFTVLEKKVLEQIIRSGADLTVCLTCDRSGGGAFALPMATARWLRGAAAEYGAAYTEQWQEPPAESGPIGFFCEHLFDFDGGAAPDNDGAVTVVYAADAAQECELAAARMAELARSGCRWRDMAVAVRGFGDYRTALESACARYGVPLFLSGRGDMLQKSVPLAIASALEAVNRGYEYEAVFGYLKTGLSPLSLEQVDLLENYVILWGVRGGGWDRDWTMHPDGYNRTMDEQTAEKLKALNAMRRAVIGPLKALERRGRAASTAAGQAAALADFFGDIRLAERLRDRTAELAGEGRYETAAECARLWETVCAALEQFAAVLGDMAMDSEGFQGLFTLMLSKYDVSVIPVSLDAVGAGDVDGMRRRHIKHLLLLGAADGRLPAPEEGGGVFTAEEREMLSAMGLALGGPEEDVSRELGRIYSCLTLPSESLYMSWPVTDGEGGEGRPSLVVERARTLLGVEPVRGDILAARTFAAGPAFALALQGQAGDDEPLCLAAREYFVRAGREADLVQLAGAARAAQGSLGPDSVRALYGPAPVMTATRAEKYANCRFGYFLQYGLKARPRQRAVFDPRDYGTFMHYILENVAREVLELGGFAAVDEAQVGALADKYVDKYIDEEMHGFADKTARFAYLFRRLRTTVRQVTADMWQELKDSKFQPLDLELDLGAQGVLEPGGPEDTPLTGRADRVDGWVHDGTLYLRITDYKTGVKKFDLADVCQGLNMQMLLYLFALEKRGKGYLGAERIRPAGVLYSPARFDVVNADSDVTEEELAALRKSAARRSGLVLDDEAVIEAMEPGEDKRFLPVRMTRAGVWSAPSEASLASLEQFGALSRYIDKTLSELAEQLRSGSVTVDPWYKTARDNACTFCDYRQACLFDETSDGWRLRNRLSTQEAWRRIEDHA